MQSRKQIADEDADEIWRGCRITVVVRMLIARTEEKRCTGERIGGVEAGVEQETAYIDAVRKDYYAALPNMPVPLSEENFRLYGSNSSPTLVLIDRKGIVRLYHPGGMSYHDLAAAVQSIVGD